MSDGLLFNVSVTREDPPSSCRVVTYAVTSWPEYGQKLGHFRLLPTRTFWKVWAWNHVAGTATVEGYFENGSPPFLTVSEEACRLLLAKKKMLNDEEIAKAAVRKTWWENIKVGDPVVLMTTSVYDGDDPWVLSGRVVGPAAKTEEPCWAVAWDRTSAPDRDEPSRMPKTVSVKCHDGVSEYGALHIGNTYGVQFIALQPGVRIGRYDGRIL